MSDQNFRDCKQLKKLLTAETKVIKEHLAEHKWFQHIPDENSGVIDFVEKYGWIMREMYCGYACPDRFECRIARDFVPKEDMNEKPKTVADKQQESPESKDEGRVCENDVGFGV